ncbi:MAG: hypothetical protein EBX44_14585 [Betaproteobacteria bacterium]|nr:hypothetical protein [Betaproteobacteria bacterium]
MQTKSRDAPKPRLGRQVSAGLALAFVTLLSSGCGESREDDRGLTVRCADIQHGCDLGDGRRLQFSAAPKVLSPILVSLEGPHVPTVVSAHLSMVGMSMPPVDLILLARPGGPGGSETHLQGQLILPICSQGRTDWRLTLDLDGHPANLLFETQSQ